MITVVQIPIPIEELISDDDGIWNVSLKPIQ